LVIGIIELVGLIIQFISGIGSYASGGAGKTGSSYGLTLSGVIGGVIGFVIGLIVVILLLYGLNKIKPVFVIPHLVMQIIGIVLLIISAIGYFVMAGIAGSGSNEDFRRQETNRGAVIGVLVGAGFVMLAIALVEVFFFWVILRAYRYLKDRKFADDAAGHMPMSTGGYSSVEKTRTIS
jgi:hypothetical protein